MNKSPEMSHELVNDVPVITHTITSVLGLDGLLDDLVPRHGNRDVFSRFYDWIHQHAGTTIVPASRQLLEDGMHLYRYRRDKDWPLTDCISFVLMEDEGIRDALTGDQHFEQAGFTALLK